MSNMVVSLLLKVREEGGAAIGKIKDGLASLGSQDRAEGIGRALAWNLHQGAIEARALSGHFLEAKKRGGELVETVVHGTFGIGAMVYAFKKGFLEIAQDREQLRNRLEAIEGSPGRGETAFHWLSEFRTHTAETMAEVTRAYAELRERHINPLNGSLKAIADTAAATGSSLSAVAAEFGNVVTDHALGRMRALGVEMIDRGNLIAVRYSYLGKTITETFSKLNRQALQFGLVQILDKLHGGASDKAAASFKGTMSSMGEAWEDFVAEVMEKGGVLKYLTDQLHSFGEDGKAMSEGQKSNAEALAETFKMVIRYGFEAVRFLREHMPTAIAHVKNFVEAVGGIRNVALGVAAVLAGPFVASLLMIGTSTLGLVISGVGLLSSGLVAVGTVLVGTVIPAIWSLGVAFMSTPIGWITAGIAALAFAAYELYEHWDAVKALLVAVWEELKAAWTRAWENFSGVVDRSVERVIAAWQPVKQFFLDLWSFIRTGWDNSLGLVSRGIDKVRSLLPSFGSAPPAAASAEAGLPGPGTPKVDGKIDVAITIDGDGRPRARVSSTSSGPLDIDAGLGNYMVFGP